MKAVLVTIMKCNGCGRLALSLDNPKGFGHRITDHKCAGSWTTLLTQEVLLGLVEEQAYEREEAWKSSDLLTRRTGYPIAKVQDWKLSYAAKGDFV
jgi:hypothetical protein